MIKPKIFIIPGNGDSHIDTDHWYAWVRDELRSQGYEVFAHDMPDADAAHANIWLPYISQIVGENKNVILIGHSSGAVAILRYLENHEALEAIIVGASYTDLGEEVERESGYFSSPWQWEKIKANVSWIVQFASTDDPYIPPAEPRFIHEQLNTEYYELTGRGHFMIDQNPVNNTIPEILEVIKSKMI